MDRSVRAALARTSAAASTIVLVVAIAGASRPETAAPGMSFRLRVTLRHNPTNGRRPGALRLVGRGQFADGHGRVDIDSASPGPFRKGDFIIIQDSVHSLWAHARDSTVSRMNSPLVNPLEGISDRLSGTAGLPSDLRATFDTVSLSDSVNGTPARHYRIQADATYPVGSREVVQKVTVEYWLTSAPVRINNPFGSRIRGLPAADVALRQYRGFITTLDAANRVFGDAVTLKTVSTTNYNYGGGMAEEYQQTVEVLDLSKADIDNRTFMLPDEFRRKPQRP